MTFAIQIGKDDWCFQQGDIHKMNHSCDPNTWWEGYGTLTARRDISCGEEVTFDYSTSEITLSYEMKCNCGSSVCRGIITNQDYLEPDFQHKYANHLPEHVVEAIKLSEQGESDACGEGADVIPEHIAEAIKKAKLNEAEYREKYGDQYLFEMLRQLVLKK